MVVSILMNECLGLNLEFTRSTITSQFSTHLSCSSLIHLCILPQVPYCYRFETTFSIPNPLDIPTQSIKINGRELARFNQDYSIPRDNRN